MIDNVISIVADMRQDEVKLILKELIITIPFQGVSDETLLNVCMNLDLTNSFCKFQNGIYSAIEYIAEDLNKSMKVDLESSSLTDMRVHERIRLAIKILLLKYAKLPNYRKLLKTILFFSVLPKNLSFSSRLLYKTVSTIWYSIHDQSTNFDYYTKRVILAAVYLSTVLFFINDYSNGFTNTLLFLDRSVDGIIMFQNIKNILEKSYEGFFS